MKFHILSNGRKNGLSKIRSFFDFFFPYGEMIRAEMANDDMNNMQFFTFRAAFVHLVWSPIAKPFIEARKIFDLYRFIYEQTGAIAFDSQGSHAGQGGVTSQTFALTCTGANRMVQHRVMDSQHRATGVAFNGTALTFIIEKLRTGTQYVEQYYLVNPDTGASYNMVTSLSPAGDVSSAAGSYSGVNQSMTYTGGSPTDRANSASGSAADVSIIITPYLDNSWSFLSVVCVANPTASTGSNLVVANGAEGDGCFDSGAAITPAGDHTMSLTFSNGAYAVVVASFSPVQATPSTPSRGRIQGHGR